MKIYTVLLAGGSGTRMKSAVNKALIPLCGKTVVRRSAEAFSPMTDEMVVVCHADVQPDIMREINAQPLPFPVRFTAGGETRQQSVLRGLLALDIQEGDMVLVHDVARCLVTPGVIGRVISSVKEYGSGVPAVPVSSTYKICDDEGIVLHTPERKHLFEIQTPQGFRAAELLAALRKAAEDGFEGTDDASVMEHYGYTVRTVSGEKSNLKLTTQEDLAAAKNYLTGVPKQMRIGMGYDVHRLVEGRGLFLCGVEIPWDLGLLGHSDADVALHALMDAMLGACGLRDIGYHFPDTDGRYKGISSLRLLSETRRIIGEAGFSVVNADVTIVAQRPKLLPYIPQMITTVAKALGIRDSAVSIKATTTEKLGFEGREEGISAYAVCMVETSA